MRDRLFRPHIPANAAARKASKTMTKLAVALTLLSFALLTPAAEHFDTSVIDPAGAGMNPQKLAEIPARMKEFVAAGTISGVVTIVARHGKVAEFDAIGLRDIESNSPMQKDSLFRIASLTKPVTCAAIMVLQDEGRLSLIDPVEKYLPEYKGLKMNPCRAGSGVNCQAVAPHRPINLEDLMTHTSGLPASADPGKGPEPKTLAESVGRGAHSELLFEPGTSWNYSNLGIDILGRIVEIVGHKPFDQFLKERIFDPLGMMETGFVVPAEKRARMATLYNFATGKPERIEAKWGSAGVIPVPAGGLISTASDMLRFNEMMRSKGVLDGNRVLSPAAVELMTISHTGEIEAGWVTGVGHGFGYEVVREVRGMFRYNSIGTFVKGGAYRTYEWVDPARDMAGVIMMQRNNGGGDSSDETNAFIAISTAAIEP
jgi:CubicO group peptidase (beta-lactamase class C family)